MTTKDSDIDTALAERLRVERLARNWSMQDFAMRSGVSKAMIGRIEQADVSPTANLLSKLSSALGMTLSTLLARTEKDQGEHRTRSQQSVWTDPETQYLRRAVSEPGAKGAEIAEITLPAKSEVHFEMPAHIVSNQQIVVLDGALVFKTESANHKLAAGDWFLAPNFGARTFANEMQQPCRYLIISQ